MAKEIKRSSSKDFKGKKSFTSKRGKGNNTDKKPSFGSPKEDSRPFGAYMRKDEKEGKDNKNHDASQDSDSKYAKKTPYNRSGDDSRPTKDSKHFKNKELKDGKAYEPKNSRLDKRDNKPSFERFRDDSRPSDFDISKKRKTSDFGDSAKKTPFNRAPFKKKFDGGDEKPSFRDRGDEKPKTFGKKSFSDKPDFKKRRDDDVKPSFRERGDEKPKTFDKKSFSDKPAFIRKSDEGKATDMIDSDFEYGNEKPKYTSDSGRGFKKSKPYEKKPFHGKKTASKPQRETDDGLIRLNKYLSNAGICSRREADELISSGVVQVNGKNITEMGFRVKPTDIVKYGGQTLKKERLVYLILNKPKDYITTADDPQERRTVLELVQGACKERVYPVGRLDRATTGLLMFTNDGDLTKKLTHPRYGIRKIYHAELDKPLKRVDLDAIAAGIELEDGPIKVDEISYVGDSADKTQIGVEIHSGKNRIVRRIFEHLGYNVRKLDRVMFGSLTKKDLPRGRWRILTDAEVGMLKMISAE